jgi:hypothetical protein
VAEIHTLRPKNPTTANNIIQIKNKNHICFFLIFHFNNIKNKNIKPQYNKNNHHHQNDITPSCIASNPGNANFTIKLNANNDQTNNKLVQNNFREIFLCCLAKIC